MDALHALEILTEDCWREVFKKVWSPGDLKSCSETCTTFEGILERKRNSWLFHAILPHILKYLSVPIDPGEPANVWRRVWWRRNWNAMYNCRIVCKDWRKGTDQHLETHNNCFEGVCKPTCADYDFGYRTLRGEFQEMYEDFTGNPFIGRYIRIDHIGVMFSNPEAEGIPNVLQNYTVNLRQIFDNFGSQIWSLCIKDIAWAGNLSFCKNIQTILGMLPNLKSLQLQPLRYNNNFRPNEMNQLPDFLEANPLPDNPILENLALSSLHIMMARPLLDKYGPQLKCLQLCNPKHFEGKARQFQRLQKLEIWSNDASESFKELHQLRSPLSSLHINVKLQGDSRTFPIDEFIQNIQHLPVTDLIISTWNPLKGILSAFPDSLRHCSVRRVKITSFTRSIISCNFLRCFPNLEVIHFNYELGVIPKPGQRSNILVVTNAEEEMYDSGIWDILPHLQIITVKAFYGQRRKEYRRSTVEMRRFEETKEVLAALF